MLLKNNAKPELFIEEEYTPLILATQKNNIKVIELLLEYKSDPDRIISNTSAMITASRKGFLEVVALLLNKGANPNLHIKENNATPLFVAAKEGHIEIVKLLLNALSNQKLNLRELITENTLEKESAFSIANKQGHTQIIQLFEEILNEEKQLTNIEEKTLMIVEKEEKAKIKQEKNTLSLSYLQNPFQEQKSQKPFTFSGNPFGLIKNKESSKELESKEIKSVENDEKEGPDINELD